MTSHRSRFSILNSLKSLEDERYPSIGPHLRLLGFAGLLHLDVSSKISRFNQFLFYFTLAFIISQYLKILINFNIDSMLLIPENGPYHIGIVKACFFIKDYKKWEELIRYVSQTELSQIRNGNVNTKKIITSYIRHSRLLTYAYCTSSFLSVVNRFYTLNKQPYTCDGGKCEYTKMFDGYIPYGDRLFGYYLSLITQNVVGYIGAVYVVGWDTLTITIMIFFTGQLRIMRCYCAQMIDAQNSIISHKNIADCHHFYTTLLKLQELFNDITSPSMFIYLLVISFNLGLCSIEIATISTDSSTLFRSCWYLYACLIQLLAFYWYGNEVTEASLQVSYGVFESDWYQVENKYQQEVQLLGIATTKRLAFTVGPFHEMTLQTFVSILRGTYSIYTLLRETN